MLDPRARVDIGRGRHEDAPRSSQHLPIYVSLIDQTRRRNSEIKSIVDHIHRTVDDLHDYGYLGLPLTILTEKTWKQIAHDHRMNGDSQFSTAPLSSYETQRAASSSKSSAFTQLSKYALAPSLSVTLRVILCRSRICMSRSCIMIAREIELVDTSRFFPVLVRLLKSATVTNARIAKS
jgi:hypothetical protein